MKLGNLGRRLSLRPTLRAALRFGSLAAALAVAPAGAHAAGVLVFGAEKGDSPRVLVRTNPATADIYPEVVAASFFAFDEGFKGGVRVAVGDFDADPTLELVTASGAGMSGTVKIWNLLDNGELDPDKPLQESFSSPFSGISGGLFVAAGDFDASGKDSLVVSAGSGQCRIWIFDDFETVNPADDLLGNSLVDTMLAFGSSFKKGCRIAMGITNPDAREDLVCANGAGNSSHVIRIFRDTDSDSMLSDETLLDTFIPTINGPYKGMFITVGNISEATTNGEIAVHVIGGGNSTIRVFNDSDSDGIFSEHAITETFSVISGKSTGGLRICAGGLDGDSRAELIICGRPKTGTRPDFRLLEATTAADANVGDATPVIVPYIDSLITTYFTRAPFCAWSD